MDVVMQKEKKGARSWVSCHHCRELIYGKRFERNLHVCPRCETHHRLDAHQRVQQLLDPDSSTELKPPEVLEDPLHFTGTHPYSEQLRQAREDTGLDEAVLIGTGTVLSRPVVYAIMDFRFLGGSLGVGVGERFTRACEVALERRTPFLVVAASGGARMQEGTHALLQMTKTGQAMAALDKAGVLTLSLITDPTYGGVAASFATLSDVIIAEPGARIGFAGSRVIEQTVGQHLPRDFQTAEFMNTRGFIDSVVPRAELRSVIGFLLRTTDRVSPRPVPERDPRIEDRNDLPDMDPWKVVGLSRHERRPVAVDHLHCVFDSFHELKGDRVSGDCPAVVGGLALLDGSAVCVIAQNKGRSTTERIRTNFGMALPEGYRKSARLMLLAEKLGLPVVCLIDTPGGYPGVEAEEHGQAWAIAENIRLMSRLRVPVLSVIIGEGGSGGALALASGDKVIALSNSVYSVISPEGCASILWKDPSLAARAARQLRFDSRELLQQGIVDAVVPEPPGGAHLDPTKTSENLGAVVRAFLSELEKTKIEDLLLQRHKKFRNVGRVKRNIHDG